MTRGKIIYNPSGKAGEYSYWAANFYNGCSANCDYCYLKKGVLSHVWSTTPTLKKSLVDVATAKKIFEKELQSNLKDLRRNGLFFNFTSDPFLKSTIDLNMWAIKMCGFYHVPVKTLTKQTWYMEFLYYYGLPSINVCTGFTLTGHDEQEPGAATNSERIKAMKILYRRGNRTWASIEPVIDFQSSLDMINKTKDFCYLYKIGLQSGKIYDPHEVRSFAFRASRIPGNFKIYFKDELLKVGHIGRDCRPREVTRNFKLWEA